MLSLCEYVYVSVCVTNEKTAYHSELFIWANRIKYYNKDNKATESVFCGVCTCTEHFFLITENLAIKEMYKILFTILPSSLNRSIDIIMDVCHDTRSIFWLSLTGLNWELSFFYSDCLTKAKEPNMPNYLPTAGKEIIGFIVPCDMSVSLIQDLNWCCRVHFLRR